MKNDLCVENVTQEQVVTCFITVTTVYRSKKTLLYEPHEHQQGNQTFIIIETAVNRFWLPQW